MTDTIEIKLMDHCQVYEIEALLDNPANFIDFLLTISQLGSRLLYSNGAYRRKLKDCRKIIRECGEFLFSNTVSDLYTNTTYECKLADWEVQNMMSIFPGFFDIVNETISLRTFMDHMPCQAVEKIYHWCGLALADTRVRHCIEIQVVAKLVKLYCIMNASTRQLKLETTETGEYFESTQAVNLLYRELREDLRYCMNECNNGQVDIQSLLCDFHNILSEPTTAIIGPHISEGNSCNKYFFNSIPYVQQVCCSQEFKSREEPTNNFFLDLVKGQENLFRSEVMDERELHDKIQNIGSALKRDEITVDETIEILLTLSPHGKTLFYYLRFHRKSAQEGYLEIIKNIYEKGCPYSLPGQIWGGSTDCWQLNTETQTVSINDQWDRCTLLNQIIDVTAYITEISPKEDDNINIEDSACLLHQLKTTTGVVRMLKYFSKNEVKPAYIKTLFNRPLSENSCKTLGNYVLEAAIFNPRVCELLRNVHMIVVDYLLELERGSIEDENVSRINETYAADKMLVKTFAFGFNKTKPWDNIDFHWDQLQNPARNRPIKNGQNNIHNHSNRVNPRTGVREDHPQFGRQRPSEKHESHDTIKKTSLTLEPRDGKIRPYHSTRGVGLLYDRDDCNMKNEKYVWIKNMFTNGRFWLRNTTHRNNKSMEMDDLIAYINETDRRGGRIVRRHNEILACPSLKSVKAVCTLSGQVDSLITAVYCQQHILFKYGVYLPLVRHDSELGKKIYTIDEIVDVLESRDIRNKTLGKDSVERWFDTLFTSYGNTSYYNSYNNFIRFLKDHSMCNVDQLRLYFFEESLRLTTDIGIEVLNMLRHGGFSINQLSRVFDALAHKQTPTNVKKRTRESLLLANRRTTSHTQRKHVTRGRQRHALNNGYQEAICLLAQYCITRTNSATREMIIDHQQEFSNLTSFESMAPLLSRLGLEEMADVLRAHSYRQELSSRNAMDRSHRDSDDATNDEDDSMCMHTEFIIPPEIEEKESRGITCSSAIVEKRKSQEKNNIETRRNIKIPRTSHQKDLWTAMLSKYCKIINFSNTTFSHKKDTHSAFRRLGNIVFKEMSSLSVNSARSISCLMNKIQYKLAVYGIPSSSFFVIPYNDNDENIYLICVDSHAADDLCSALNKFILVNDKAEIRDGLVVKATRSVMIGKFIPNIRSKEGQTDEMPSSQIKAPNEMKEHKQPYNRDTFQKQMQQQQQQQQEPELDNIKESISDIFNHFEIIPKVIHVSDSLHTTLGFESNDDAIIACDKLKQHSDIEEMNPCCMSITDRRKRFIFLSSKDINSVLKNLDTIMSLSEVDQAVNDQSRYRRPTEKHFGSEDNEMKETEIVLSESDSSHKDLISTLTQIFEGEHSISLIQNGLQLCAAVKQSNSSISVLDDDIALGFSSNIGMETSLFSSYCARLQELLKKNFQIETTNSIYDGLFTRLCDRENVLLPAAILISSADYNLLMRTLDISPQNRNIEICANGLESTVIVEATYKDSTPPHCSIISSSIPSTRSTYNLEHKLAETLKLYEVYPSSYDVIPYKDNDEHIFFQCVDLLTAQHLCSVLNEFIFENNEHGIRDGLVVKATMSVMIDNFISDIETKEEPAQKMPSSQIKAPKEIKKPTGVYEISPNFIDHTPTTSSIEPKCSAFSSRTILKFDDYGHQSHKDLIARISHTFDTEHSSFLYQNSLKLCAAVTNNCSSVSTLGNYVVLGFSDVSSTHASILRLACARLQKILNKRFQITAKDSNLEGLFTNLCNMREEVLILNSILISKEDYCNLLSTFDISPKRQTVIRFADDLDHTFLFDPEAPIQPDEKNTRSNQKSEHDRENLSSALHSLQITPHSVSIVNSSAKILRVDFESSQNAGDACTTLNELYQLSLVVDGPCSEEHTTYISFCREDLDAIFSTLELNLTVKDQSKSPRSNEKHFGSEGDEIKETETVLSQSDSSHKDLITSLSRSFEKMHSLSLSNNGFQLRAAVKQSCSSISALDGYVVLGFSSVTDIPTHVYTRYCENLTKLLQKDFQIQTTNHGYEGLFSSLCERGNLLLPATILISEEDYFHLLRTFNISPKKQNVVRPADDLQSPVIVDTPNENSSEAIEGEYINMIETALENDEEKTGLIPPSDSDQLSTKHHLTSTNLTGLFSQHDSPDSVSVQCFQCMSNVLPSFTSSLVSDLSSTRSLFSSEFEPVIFSIKFDEFLLCIRSETRLFNKQMAIQLTDKMIVSLTHEDLDILIVDGNSNTTVCHVRADDESQRDNIIRTFNRAILALSSQEDNCLHS